MANQLLPQAQHGQGGAGGGPEEDHALPCSPADLFGKSLPHALSLSSVSLVVKTGKCACGLPV